jgi:plasmid stability protein
MDSRQKIVSPDRLQELVNEGGWTVLAGAFDPLTAGQTRRIAAKAAEAAKLAIIVEAAAHDYLLTAEARAILVAAMRHVDAVAIMEDAPTFLGDVPVERDQPGEHARTQAFIKFIAARQAGVPL